MSYDDLRKGRFSQAGRIYFVTTVTYKRTKLFASFHTARVVIQSMMDLDNAKHVNSLSWVIMPDHLHWLFQLGDICSLSEVMKRMKATSARSINQLLTTQGRVWQKSYYDHALRQEEDIRQLSRYIVANPLRAGLVDNIGDYPHWDAAWL